MTDREKLTELVEESFADQHDRRRMLTVPDTVNHLLANGVVVREEGEWLHVCGKGRHAEYECSECKIHVCFDEKIGGDIPAYNFCPNCGADMRKGENG